jgi:hypothetical protein
MIEASLSASLSPLAPSKPFAFVDCGELFNPTNPVSRNRLCFGVDLTPIDRIGFSAV